MEPVPDKLIDDLRAVIAGADELLKNAPQKGRSMIRVPRIIESKS